MKQKLSKEFVLVAGLATMMATLFLTSDARAQGGDVDVAPLEVREMRIEERQAEREMRIEERAEQMEERRALFTEQVQNRLINLESNVTDRLRSMNTRMGNILARLQTRVEKLDAMGVDTSIAYTPLSGAMDTITDTTNALADLGSVREAMDGGTPKEDFDIIRTDLLKVHGLVKQTHAQLREAVALLKEAVREAELERGVRDAVSNTVGTEDASTMSEEN